MMRALALVPATILLLLPLGVFEAIAAGAAMLAVHFVVPRTPAVLAVALLVAAAPVQALVLEDGTGDVQINVNDGDVAALPGGVKDSIDLVSIDITETPQEITFIVQLAALDSPGDEFYADKVIEIFFEHKGKRYAIGYSNIITSQDGAYLGEFDNGTGFYRYMEPVAVERVPSENALHFSLDRTSLPDSHGASPTKGSSFTNIHGYSAAPYLASTLVSLFPSIVTGDRLLVTMEDHIGEEPGLYDLQLGLPQAGTGRLASDRPFRVSNGEAGTFVYWVQASRIAEGTGDYQVSVSDVPQGWAVQVPTGTLTISQPAPVSIPVVVQTAFAHAHGDIETFRLLIEDEDGAKGQMEMGIRYPLIPQPAGHHNRLWLHSMENVRAVLDGFIAPAENAAWGADSATVPYMNAMEEDERNNNKPTYTYQCGSTATTTKYCIEIPLDPGLQMGLDWRPEDDGRLEVAFRSPVPLPGAKVTGHITKYTTTEEEFGPGFRAWSRTPTVLATIPASEAKDLDSSAKSFELVVKPTKASDYVPYDPKGSLSLHLNVTVDLPKPILVIYGVDPTPQLMPGGVLELPLEEYKDKVEDLPSFGKDLEWILERDQREANPGDVIVYHAVLQNKGDTDTFAIRLLGHNHEWGELLAAPEVKVKSNGTAEATVIVRVPDSAAIGSTADLVLEAASLNDVSKRQLVQFRTVVVEEPVEDDAALLGSLETDDKKSPGAPLMLLIAGIALALRRLK